MFCKRLVIAENQTASGYLLERLLKVFPDDCDVTHYRAAQGENGIPNPSSPIKMDGDTVLLGH